MVEASGVARVRRSYARPIAPLCAEARGRDRRAGCLKKRRCGRDGPDRWRSGVPGATVEPRASGWVRNTSTCGLWCCRSETTNAVWVRDRMKRVALVSTTTQRHLLKSHLLTTRRALELTFARDHLRLNRSPTVTPFLDKAGGTLTSKVYLTTNHSSKDVCGYGENDCPPPGRSLSPAKGTCCVATIVRGLGLEWVGRRTITPAGTISSLPLYPR
jgi:hypothetical protein